MLRVLATHVACGYDISYQTVHGSFLLMRIAQIPPLHEAVPPKLYGGTERVVSWLTDELVRMGHEVTLFGTGDSVTDAHLESVWPRALRLDPAIRDPIAPHMLLLERVACAAKDFDILHFHLDYWPFTYFGRQQVPFVTTMHGRLDLPELQPVFNAFPRVPVVSISDSQRIPLPQARYAGTVLHGMPETLLTPRPGKREYFAFLGRICPEKGVDKAIRIARAAGVPLKIAAKIDKVDAEYFDREILPMLGDGVELIGEINDRQKPDFLSGAKALLMPIDWPEPFGLVMIEAMACGTPVIAFRRGSVPEVIEDGLTGRIVDDEQEAIRACNHLDIFSHEQIRARFEERFTSRRMAQDYLGIYETLIEEKKALQSI